MTWDIAKPTPIYTNLPYNRQQCTFRKKFDHNVQTCTKKCKTLNDLNNRIQPSLNNIIDGGRVPNGWEDVDKDFFIAQWIDQGLGMKDAYQACIKVCPIWKDIYAGPEKSKKNVKYRNGFMYVQNLNKQWRLVLPGIFNAKGKNFLEIAISEAYAATGDGTIKKTIKPVTDKCECQSFSCLVREYLRICNICQRTKY